MCRFIESIKYLNGTLHNIAFHEYRLNRTRKAFYGIDQPLSLKSIQPNVELKKDQVYKCRIVYGKDVEQIQWLEYHPKSIRTLQCVYDDSVVYAYKHLDRSRIQLLFEKRDQADDILIIKNDFITDSSYTNIAFIKNGQWFTPNTPLLPGTKRAYYIKKGLLKAVPITVADIISYDGYSLINAFWDLSIERVLPAKSILL